MSLLKGQKLVGNMRLLNNFQTLCSILQDKLELGIGTTSSTTSTTKQVTTTATLVADLATTTHQKTTAMTTQNLQNRRKSSTSWLPSVSFNR